MNLAEYLVSASPWFVSNKELAEYLISAKFNSEGSGCRRASLTMEDPEPVDMGNSLLIDFLGDVSLFPTATSNPVSPYQCDDCVIISISIWAYRDRDGAASCIAFASY
ncbi:hypothetical protein BASA81_010976 [Batrachochytrium salamandrivorans]|nr:hypothetical protein BASA81_010976 [Batrachochytrium salamandrivorans]